MHALGVQTHYLSTRPGLSIFLYFLLRCVDFRAGKPVCAAQKLRQQQKPTADERRGGAEG
jgi:hypothetical protein